LAGEIVDLVLGYFGRVVVEGAALVGRGVEAGRGGEAFGSGRKHLNRASAIAQITLLVLQRLRRFLRVLARIIKELRRVIDGDKLELGFEFRLVLDRLQPDLVGLLGPRPRADVDMRYTRLLRRPEIRLG
jgi:hypothetical protein